MGITALFIFLMDNSLRSLVAPRAIQKENHSFLDCWKLKKEALLFFQRSRTTRPTMTGPTSEEIRLFSNTTAKSSNLARKIKVPLWRDITPYRVR
jgi:hypothetical protein